MLRGIIYTLISILFSLSLFSQTSDGEERRRIERELRGSTPGDIQERLRQAGISRDDAVRRARERGISLEDYFFPEEPVPEDTLRGPVRRLDPFEREQVINRRLRQLNLEPDVALRTAQREGETLTEFLFPDMPTENIERTLGHRLNLYGLTMNQARSRAQSEGLSLEEFVFPGRPFPEPIVEEREDIHEKFLVEEFRERDTAAELEAFGYNIFRFPAATFEPVLNIPPPPGYRLGPGDELIISVWGEVQLYHRLTITREGSVIVPDVGRVMAAGLTIEQIRDRLQQNMARVYSSLDPSRDGVRSYLDVSVGTLRTLQVFVLGDVRRPGGYTVSSMSTAMTALYYAGGPSIYGSLRDIRVMRGNQESARIDFYDYALRGDRSNDVRLEDGDIIFVPPVGSRVGLAGSVKRPAIYEVKDGEGLGDLISMAGGLRFDAHVDRIHIERIVPFAQRRDFRYSMLDIDVRFEDADEVLVSDYRLEAGDVVSVFTREPRYENRVRIVGNVFNPGIYELGPDMRVSDLIRRADGLLDDTFRYRATLVRVREADLRKEILRVDLQRALDGDPDHDIPLKRLDELYVYSQEYFFPEQTVTISGEIRHPGTYTRGSGMTAEDLIVIAGGATEEAMLSEVTVSRIDTSSERTYTEIYRIGVPDEYWTIRDNPGGFLLSDFDHVEVPADPRKSRQLYVDIEGEVRYPGRYAIIDDNERIASLIERAGGLRETAYIDGARVFRSVEGSDRLVPISLRRALDNPRSPDNIQIKDQDEITIPRDPGVVIVRGAVNVPAAVRYEPGKGPGYYLKQAGGFADRADRRRTTVTLPNGQMWEPSGWFFVPNDEILSGSVINVPRKEPRDGRALEIMRDWTMLMASTAAIIVGIIQITR
jgi:polysaccharide biosynthesis/export protein